MKQSAETQLVDKKTLETLHYSLVLEMWDAGHIAGWEHAFKSIYDWMEKKEKITVENLDSYSLSLNGGQLTELIGKLKLYGQLADWWDFLYTEGTFLERPGGEGEIRVKEIRAILNEIKESEVS